MASIDDLFDDDPIDVLDTGGYSQEEYNTSEEANEEDVITTLLRRLGISDPEKIKFEGEDGELEERSWNDLSYEELLNILSGNDSDSSEDDNDLDDNEIDLINAVRLANISPEEYLQQVKQQAILEYLANGGGYAEPTYAVDDYTDDELFIYDMKIRMPELTDDELVQALDSAKANEVVFNKLINGLRQEYKKLEDNKNQQELMLAQQLQQELYNQYANTVWESIVAQSDIAGTFELEDEDKLEIAQFILGYDQAGLSIIGKALSDPLTLIEMSWFALKGREAIDSINDYYKEQITKAREAGYKKGLEDGKNGGPASSKVVVKKQPISKSNKVYRSIDDLDFD